MELAFDKTAEERGRGSPIEAMIVIQNSHAHEKGMENLLVSRKWGEICKCPSFSCGCSFPGPRAEETALPEIPVLFSPLRIQAPDEVKY
jgi:hypothetical protein